MTEPLIRDRRRGVHVARPMFQVLPDDSEQCNCHLWPDYCVIAGMDVPASEYDRKDRVFL